MLQNLIKKTVLFQQSIKIRLLLSYNCQRFDSETWLFQLIIGSHKHFSPFSFLVVFLDKICSKTELLINQHTRIKHIQIHTYFFIFLYIDIFNDYIPDIIPTGKRLFNYKRPPLPAQYLISHPPYLSAPPKNSICCSKISPAGRSHGSCPYFSKIFKVWNKASQPVNVISSNTQKTNKNNNRKE